MRCKHSHGRKESEYHPENFRTRSCPDQACTKPHCDKYHSSEEKIKPKGEYFKILPKCRIVNFPSNYYSQLFKTQKSTNDSNNSKTKIPTEVVANDVFINRLPHTKINKKDLVTSQHSNSSSQTKLLSVHSASFVPLNKNVSSSDFHTKSSGL